MLYNICYEGYPVKLVRCYTQLNSFGGNPYKTRTAARQFWPAIWTRRDFIEITLNLLKLKQQRKPL